MKISPASVIKIFLILTNLNLIILIILSVIHLNFKPAQTEPLAPPTKTSTQKQESGKAKGAVKQKKNTRPNLLSFKETILAERLGTPDTQTNYLNKKSSKYEVLGWIPFWDQGRAFSSLKKNADRFNHVSLFWYNLKADGSLRKYIYAHEDRSIINFAHTKGIKVLALVANLPDEDEGGDWDYRRVDKAIGTSAARKKHISDLVALSKRIKVDGINIDYEAMKEYQKGDFTIFVKELANALHKNGKILAVALHPKDSEGNPAFSNGSEAQDWKALSKYADQLHLMTYEEHWSTSPPGPIASIPWVRSVLSYAKKLIPKEKLFTGVSLYGYDWGNAPRARGLTYADVKNLIKKYDPKVLFDKKSGSKHFGYRDSAGISHTVWFEDNNTFRAKLSLFNSLGTANLAFWRPGGEDPRIWQALR